MRLTPTERDRLLIFTAAELARARRARGLLMNVPEATALIADAVCEAARDGKRVAEAAEVGRSVLSLDEVLPGVADVVTEVKVEAVFDDGTRMVVVRSPFQPGDDATTADADELPVGGIAPPASDADNTHDTPDLSTPTPNNNVDVENVEVGDVDVADVEVVRVDVVNTSDVPVSITSHFHFFEINRRLDFDRSAAYGMHLAIPAGSALRFPPGETVTAPLVAIGGERIAIGFAGLVDGPLDADGAKAAALDRARNEGYLGA